MKKFFFLFSVFFILVFNSESFGQSIAYANLDKIIKTSIVGKKIISYFSEKNNKILEELKKKELEIKEKENKLIAQKNLLQETEFKKKVDLIKEEINKFNDLSKSKINQLNVEKQTVSKAFLNEINKVIKEYAEKNKIDMIFSSNQMLIGKSSLDLTENILQNVNKNIKNFEIN